MHLMRMTGVEISSLWECVFNVPIWHDVLLRRDIRYAVLSDGVARSFPRELIMMAPSRPV